MAECEERKLRRWNCQVSEAGVKGKKINSRMSLGDHLHDLGLDEDVSAFFPIKQIKRFW